MADWRVVGIVFEGQPIDVGGLNPWNHKWQQVEADNIMLPHPQYPSQVHSMYIYEIDGDDNRVRFATGELSANVWGFYVPTT